MAGQSREMETGDGEPLVLLLGRELFRLTEAQLARVAGEPEIANFALIKYPGEAPRPMVVFARPPRYIERARVRDALLALSYRYYFYSDDDWEGFFELSPAAELARLEGLTLVGRKMVLKASPPIRELTAAMPIGEMSCLFQC